MDIKKELLSKLLSESIMSYLDFTHTDFKEKIEKEAIAALSEIQEIVKNSELDDSEAIEEIICIFEKYNLDFGSRHDY